MRKEELSEGMIVGAQPRGHEFDHAHVRVKARVIEFGIADDTRDEFRLPADDQKRHARVEVVDDRYRSERGKETAPGDRFIVPHANLSPWNDVQETRRRERLALYERQDVVIELLSKAGLGRSSYRLKSETVKIDLADAENWLKAMAAEFEYAAGLSDEPEDTGAGATPQPVVADTRGGPRRILPRRDDVRPARGVRSLMGAMNAMGHLLAVGAGGSIDELWDFGTELSERYARQRGLDPDAHSFGMHSFPHGTSPDSPRYCVHPAGRVIELRDDNLREALLKACMWLAQELPTGELWRRD